MESSLIGIHITLKHIWHFSDFTSKNLLRLRNQVLTKSAQ